MDMIDTLTIDDGQGPPLQMLHAPAQHAGAPAMLLVHGAYTSARCWEPVFMPYFRDRGYDVYAVSLRGHGGSQGREHLDLYGLADYLDDLVRAANVIGRPSTLVGSSMGGLLVQRWLTSGRAAKAAVLIGSVPPIGLAGAAMHMAFTDPLGFAGITQLAMAGSSHPKMLELLTDSPLEEAGRSLRGFYRELGRESSRVLFEMTWAPMVGWVSGLCPVLAVHGSADRMVPSSAVASMTSQLGAEPLILDGLGHAPMIDSRWRVAADAIAGWLRKSGVLPEAAAA